MIYLLLFVAILGLGYWVFMSSWSQIFGHFPYKVKTSKKVIALTFDDGPNEPYTTQVAQYLRDQEVQATFFQVAKCVERFPGISRQVMNMGHVIGNHSTHHQFHRHLVDPTFAKEIDNAQTVISRAIGRTPTLFRPPWLWRTPFLFRTLKSRGLTPVSGEFCQSFEVLQPSPESIAKAVIRKARPGLIVIFHDGVEGRTGDRSSTLDSLKIIVPNLKEQGYVFVTVDKLLGIEAYQ